MSTTTPPIVNALPTPPNPDDRATFNALAYPWTLALGAFTTQVNALGANVKGNADEAVASATAAAAERTAAAASAAAAQNQAASAAASAGASGTNAAAAEASATTANARASAAEAAASRAESAASSVTATAATVYLAGNTTTYVNQVKTFSITNYNVFSTYTASASAGSVSISGDVVTYTAPAAPGNVTFTISMGGAATVFPLDVLAAGVATPTVTSPTAGAAGVGETPTATSSAFAWLGVADAHLNSDWQLATDAAFTNVVQSSLASTTNRTSWTLGALAVSTTYFLRVRHRGTSNGVSAYSPTVSFTTAASFNSYIPAPTATPANFGDALEGGFYAGMIWNEITQSATSTTIGTGTRAFTVPNMTSAPIVYGGQSVEVRSRANPANRMQGTVTGAIGTTLTINVATVTGSGAFTDWSVMARHRVIVAPKASGESASLTYKNSNTAAPTACITLTEGRRATLAMVAADSATVYPAAHFCNNLNIGGRTDWYLPARDELELCWRNLKPTTDNNYTDTDRPTGAEASYQTLGSFGDTANTHGLNNNSAPTGAAYASTVPGRVANASFQSGGAEAFTYGSEYYWSSTQYDASGAWGQYWFSSVPGYQGVISKTSSLRVRAVRRSVI